MVWWLPRGRSLTDDERKWIDLHEGLDASTTLTSNITPTILIHRMDIKSEVRKSADDRPVHADYWNPVPVGEGNYIIRFDIPCSALNENGTCSLYGTPERPDMCGRWPDAPGQAPNGCLYNDALVGAESR